MSIVIYCPSIFIIYILLACMKYSLYSIPIISLATSICMVSILIEITKKLSTRNILTFCSVNSMIIMYLHQFIKISFVDKFFKSEVICS